MRYCTENNTFKFGILSFLLLLFRTNIVSANGVIDSGKLNNAEVGILKLFDHSLGPDTGRRDEAANNATLSSTSVEANLLNADDADNNQITGEALAIEPEVLKQLIKFGRDEPFSPTIKKHGEIAKDLIKIFMDVPTERGLQTIAKRIQSRLNPSLFMYALSVALMHRNDTRQFPIGAISELYHNKYVDRRIIYHINEAINAVGTNEPIEVWRNYTTASNREVEHSVAYFREDFGVNLYHWHWHLAYPYQGEPKIVCKDRRGELFYYMHQQILARYNAERFCNDLGYVKRLNNLREPIHEGYFSKLDSQMAKRTWPPRQSGTILKDIDRPDIDLKFDIEDLERWTNRIFEAIDMGFVIDAQGNRVLLTEKNGVEILGNVIEASPVLSPNTRYYGDLHNLGHMAIAFAHDPDYCHMESFSIMGDSATAMRDPVFYRWHAFINKFFRDHKKTLKPYTVEQLNYPGIEVSEVQVITQNGKINHLDTFWSWCDIDLSRGLDFTPKAPVRARFTHLNHTTFQYKFTVTNTLSSEEDGIVRIFIAPKNDEQGVIVAIEKQRHLMIEMDKFNVKLQPGKNIINRNSGDSSVTIPFSINSRHLSLETIPSDEEFYGCGWPQHMLVPKGTKDGFPMILFVMVSNDSSDFIMQNNLTDFKAASTLCGLRNRKYPDPRAMGYPFDRKPHGHVKTLSQFLTENMATTEINIQFTDRII